MPLRDDLLVPIPGENPSGVYLYYQPIYDKIKEARREDDDSGPSGVWARERKVADWNQVIKLAGDALATQTKDIQIAAWLAEAHLRKEGFGSFKTAIEFLTQLLEQFWDTLYPEIEDGDSEFRATPLNWIGNFDLQVRMMPITKGGKSSVDYKVSRTIGTREQAEQEGDEKVTAYTTAVSEGKVTADDFDADFEKTSKQYYVDFDANLAGCLEALERLNAVGEEKFGDYSPGYSKIRTAIEEVRNTIRILLARKREKEPDAPLPGEEAPEVEEQVEEAAEETTQSDSPRPAKKKAGGALAAEPQDLDDAIARMVSAAKFVRQQDAYSPAPYLMLAGFRAGELRASGDSLDQSKLEAPPSELRQNLKKFSMEGNWLEVLNTAEQAAGLPCGRGWLDMHRYAARACSELGWYYDGLRKGIIGLVRGLVADYPDLPKLTLMDDTPVANAETVQWLENDVVVAGAAASGDNQQYYEPSPVAPARQYDDNADGAEAPPDAWELAQQALRGGRVREAVELIDREAKMEQSGRGRFIRRTQLARIFIDSGNEPMAMPILEQIAAEIDSRGLENWEPSETIAQPLSLLYRCLVRSDKDGDATKKLYSKLCRLDPVAAMNVLR